MPDPDPLPFEDLVPSKKEERRDLSKMDKRVIVISTLTSILVFLVLSIPAVLLVQHDENDARIAGQQSSYTASLENCRQARDSRVITNRVRKDQREVYRTIRDVLEDAAERPGLPSARRELYLGAIRKMSLYIERLQPLPERECAREVPKPGPGITTPPETSPNGRNGGR